MTTDVITFTVALVMFGWLMWFMIYQAIRTGIQKGKSKDYSFANDRMAFLLLLIFYGVVASLAGYIALDYLEQIIGKL